MTGAAIVRWQAGGTVVLAVHGAFDGASAWALRVAMEESSERHFVVDLTHAIEACEFAACVLAQFVRERRRDKQVIFRPGTRAHARLLGGFGLELVEDDDPLDELPSVLSPWSPAKSGAPA